MGTCESCGRDDENVSRVQRIYLVPDEEAVQGPGESVVAEATPSAGDIEWWCGSCAATFPHMPLPVAE